MIIELNHFIMVPFLSKPVKSGTLRMLLHSNIKYKGISMDAREEKKLVAKAQKGDVDSFEKLIQMCKVKAYNLCFHYLKNEEDAQDALQETFIKIFKNLKNFKAESSFDTWVYRIAANTCNDFIKRGRKHILVRSFTDVQEDVYFDIPDMSQSPEVAFDRKEKLQMILAALEMLQELNKKAIILRDIQGFSYSQIATILNCSESAVKSRISRGRAEIREILIKHETKSKI